MRTLVTCALSFLASCGEYVRYENGPPDNQTGGTVLLDEKTQAWLQSLDSMDHVEWTGLVARYSIAEADGVRFDYAAVATSTEAQLGLDRYLGYLDVVQTAQLGDRSERLAYWVNGYNASVVRGVLDFWAGRSEYSVSENEFVFFDLPRHHFGGLVLSLNQIEHGVLRGDTTHASVRGSSDELRSKILELHAQVWEGRAVDARIHFALNCASLSCPDLWPTAFRGPTIESDFDAAAKRFANDAKKGAGAEGISQLFRFYAADFEATFGNAAGFIARHRTDGLEGVNLDRFLEYDWSLNISSR